MSRRIGRSALGMFALLTAGCAAKVQYVPLLPAPRQLYVRGPAQVEVFVVSPPARPHVDIGMLSLVWAGSEEETTQQMMYLIRAAAGQRGCDALLITRVAVGAVGFSRPGSIEGSCEVFTDVPPTTASPHP